MIAVKTTILPEIIEAIELHRKERVEAIASFYEANKHKKGDRYGPFKLRKVKKDETLEEFKLGRGTYIANIYNQMINALILFRKEVEAAKEVGSDWYISVDDYNDLKELLKPFPPPSKVKVFGR